jgi:phosphotriesterase-related protein
MRAMTDIETVTGPIGADALGTTLMHEHIFVLTPEIQSTYPGFAGWDPEKGVEDARVKL